VRSRAHDLHGVRQRRHEQPIAEQVAKDEESPRIFEDRLHKGHIEGLVAVGDDALAVHTRHLGGVVGALGRDRIVQVDRVGDSHHRGARREGGPRPAHGGDDAPKQAGALIDYLGVFYRLIVPPNEVAEDVLGER
jgi:hypothetical protein